MNINKLPAQSFKGVYICEDDMGKIAKKQANRLYDELTYSPSIDQLDQKGIDVFITSDNKSPDDKAKVIFATYDKSKVHKVGKNSYLTTLKDLVFQNPREKEFIYNYDTNYDKIVDFADEIIFNNSKLIKPG